MVGQSGPSLGIRRNLGKDLGLHNPQHWGLEFTAPLWDSESQAEHQGSFRGKRKALGTPEKPSQTGAPGPRLPSRSRQHPPQL